VTVQRNDELTSLYARAVANIVHVTLRDGRVLTKRVDYPLGNALNPVSDQQLEGKFNSLVVPALGEKGARELLAEAWKLDEAKSPNELMKLAKMPD
jgi:2-methylcitrate dehydratase PrpD